MPLPVHITQLMESSGVKFGTSGARGLVRDLTDRIAWTYTTAFLQQLELCPQQPVALAGDLRPSTDRILRAVAHAIEWRGLVPLVCGTIPSPAVALYGLDKSMPAIMVTGSHIPDDRNGIKFNTSKGEILKADEERIGAQEVQVPDIFDNTGAFLCSPHLPPVCSDASERYVRRYTDVFAANSLEGQRIGVYGHSAVGRDLIVEILEALGAQVSRLGWSDTFVPVDTEAVRAIDIELGAKWAAGGEFDALVSTDGDSDRPLVSDECGKWLRGDVAGVLCALELGARVVAVPVSCNTAVERSGFFERVVRTRIGSPYVIAAMQDAVRSGASAVVGYEANGGFLTMSPLEVDGRVLGALPTRDAVVVALAVLRRARRRNVPVSALLREIPARCTASDRLAEFPTAISTARLGELSGPEAIEGVFGKAFGGLLEVDRVDGLRMTFAGPTVVHVRPSGNAPELRCYTEAATEAAAAKALDAALGILAGWR
ncbi:MAG: phosphomannomutase [Myxococcales bacterium]